MKISRTPVVIGVILFMIALSGLFLYKASGSLRTIETVHDAGTWTKDTSPLLKTGVFASTLNYFKIIWPALVFGILIAATVRAFISPRWVMKLLGTGALRQQVVGGLAGMPLMLCSCCVTPIFTSVYECGARLGSSLAIMLASPALNLAALALTFMLFSFEMAIARVIASLVAVFLLSHLIDRIFSGRTAGVPQRMACDFPEADSMTPRQMAVRFVRSLGYIAIVTVPFIVAGVLLSAWLLPMTQPATNAGSVLSIAIVAAVAVLVALPTFFEIPLSLFLIQIGAPGAAAALLFAGPIINLPSLFVLGRETSPWISVVLALGIWLIATATGIVCGSV